MLTKFDKHFLLQPSNTLRLKFRVIKIYIFLTKEALEESIEGYLMHQKGKVIVISSNS